MVPSVGGAAATLSVGVADVSSTLDVGVTAAVSPSWAAGTVGGSVSLPEPERPVTVKRGDGCDRDRRAVSPRPATSGRTVGAVGALAAVGAVGAVGTGVVTGDAGAG
ncbi:hypothetical protein [Parafrankia sp. EUN1f]|uniref:hypothetical protein n=1 Tax=Parafrankia sp. EUN1f TaxID=102897 RepID=UPI0012FC671F|nr:hypothetical protein [Parafrankia sp. EUN1f]